MYWRIDFPSVLPLWLLVATMWLLCDLFLVLWFCLSLFGGSWKKTHWYMSLAEYGVDGYRLLGCLMFGVISFSYIFSCMEWIGSSWKLLEAQTLLVLQRSFFPTNAFLCFWCTDCDPSDYTRCNNTKSLWNCYVGFLLWFFPILSHIYQFLIVVDFMWLCCILLL